LVASKPKDLSRLAKSVKVTYILYSIHQGIVVDQNMFIWYYLLQVSDLLIFLMLLNLYNQFVQFKKKIIMELDNIKR